MPTTVMLDATIPREGVLEQLGGQLKGSGCIYYTHAYLIVVENVRPDLGHVGALEVVQFAQKLVGVLLRQQGDLVDLLLCEVNTAGDLISEALTQCLLLGKYTC